MQETFEETLLEIVKQTDFRRYLSGKPIEITEENSKNNSFLTELKEVYDSNNKMIEVRVAMSILCYMYFTNKMTMPISTKLMELVYLDDPNWAKDEVLFQKTSYKGTLALLSKMGLRRIAASNEFKPGILLATKDSPIGENYKGKIEDDLRDVFKLTKIKEVDFVDENIRELFKKYLAH